MSMHNYAYVNAGMYLQGDEIYCFVKRVAEKLNRKFEKEGSSLITPDNEWQVVMEAVGFDCYDDDEAEDFSIWNLKGEFNSLDLRLPVICIRAERESLCGMINTGGYNSVEDAVDEFKRKYGDCLSDDFDYEAHIGQMRCVMFG